MLIDLLEISGDTPLKKFIWGNDVIRFTEDELNAFYLKHDLTVEMTGNEIAELLKEEYQVEQLVLIKKAAFPIGFDREKPDNLTYLDAAKSVFVFSLLGLAWHWFDFEAVSNWLTTTYKVIVSLFNN